MTKSAQYKAALATVNRQARRRGREQVIEEYFGGEGWTPAEIAVDLERIAGAGISNNEQRNEALRGAAELLDELATLMRQSAVVNG